MHKRYSSSDYVPPPPMMPTRELDSENSSQDGIKFDEQLRHLEIHVETMGVTNDKILKTVEILEETNKKLIVQLNMISKNLEDVKKSVSKSYFYLLYDIINKLLSYFFGLSPDKKN